jgi:hypothetical protein
MLFTPYFPIPPVNDLNTTFHHYGGMLFIYAGYAGSSPQSGSYKINYSIDVLLGSRTSLG